MEEELVLGPFPPPLQQVHEVVTVYDPTGQTHGSETLQNPGKLLKDPTCPEGRWPRSVGPPWGTGPCC